MSDTKPRWQEDCPEGEMETIDALLFACRTQPGVYLPKLAEQFFRVRADNEHLRAEVERLTKGMELTGVMLAHNDRDRAALAEKLQQETRRAERAERALSELAARFPKPGSLAGRVLALEGRVAAIEEREEDADTLRMEMKERR